jgi:beta-phosphoglucomutase-like phosphatase (HAD superfamily)
MGKDFAAILFDMDGTLIDSEPVWHQVEIEVMAELGYNWQPEDQAFCLGGPLSKVGRYMSSLVEGRKEPEYFVGALVSGVTHRLSSKVETVEGALAFARDVFTLGIPSALVSASPRSLMDACLSGFAEIAPDLQTMFALSIAMDDVTETKPHPEGYLLAATKIGVNIEDALVIEDSNTGIAAGLASGAWVLAVPHLIKPEPHPRMVVIDSLAGHTVESVASLFS